MVPAWKLAELIMREDIVAARKHLEDKYVREHGLPITSPSGKTGKSDTSETDDTKSVV